MTELYLANKLKVAKQFSRAAQRYDQSAQVQIDIAFDAMQLLPRQPDSILDIGCGTGRVTRQLSKKCDKVVGVDIAEGMVTFANQSPSSNVHYIAADAEHLPFKDASFDQVFSTMALQWCDDLPGAFREIERVLMPDGSAVLAIMSASSFTELNQSWQAISPYRRVNHFTAQESLTNWMLDTDMSVEATTKSYQTWHSSVRELLASIKQIGANVVTQRREQLPLCRSSLLKLEESYANAFAHNGRLPLTYQVTFLKCQKGH